MSGVTGEVRAQIAEIVGEAGLVATEGLAAYALDGITPSVVALPDSAELVGRLLALANDAGLAVVPHGGGTAMGTGGAPRGVDLVIGTSRLARVLEYAPEDLTVSVQAGVTMAQLQALLAAKDQMLPLDPPLPEQCTAGGVVATNASGPLRDQFGMPRDLVLGTVVAYADGTVAKAGGRTVKNVAGFDMTRLHTGAYGTLGIITEMTFKVLPAPKMLVTVTGGFADLATAAAGALALRMARITPWSLALLSPTAVSGFAAGYTVAVRLGGQSAVVTPQVQRALDTLKQAKATGAAVLDGAEDSFWPAVRDWPATTGDETSLVVRLGVTPSQVGNVLAAVQAIDARLGLATSAVVLPGAATIFVHIAQAGDEKAVEAVNAIVAVVKEWKGNLTIVRCPPALKARLPIWGSATADALTRRVKNTFDAKGILNPGRFVGGL